MGKVVVIDLKKDSESLQLEKNIFNGNENCAEKKSAKREISEKFSKNVD